MKKLTNTARRLAALAFAAMAVGSAVQAAPAGAYDGVYNSSVREGQVWSSTFAASHMCPTEYSSCRISVDSVGLSGYQGYAASGADFTFSARSNTPWTNQVVPGDVPGTVITSKAKANRDSELEGNEVFFVNYRLDACRTLYCDDAHVERKMWFRERVTILDDRDPAITRERAMLTDQTTFSHHQP